MPKSITDILAPKYVVVDTNLENPQVRHAHPVADLQEGFEKHMELGVSSTLFVEVDLYDYEVQGELGIITWH